MVRWNRKSTAHAGTLLYLWWEAPGNLTEPQTQQDAVGVCFIFPFWSDLKRSFFLDERYISSPGVPSFFVGDMCSMSNSDFLERRINNNLSK